jgi:hypothetical protein
VIELVIMSANNDIVPGDLVQARPNMMDYGWTLFNDSHIPHNEYEWPYARSWGYGTFEQGDIAIVIAVSTEIDPTPALVLCNSGKLGWIRTSRLELVREK